MAIKYFPANTEQQKNCKHEKLILKSAQKIDKLYSVNYECEVCGLKVQTDGYDKIDKKAEIDKIATSKPVD